MRWLSLYKKNQSKLKSHPAGNEVEHPWLTKKVQRQIFHGSKLLQMEKFPIKNSL